MDMTRRLRRTHLALACALALAGPMAQAQEAPSAREQALEARVAELEAKQTRRVKR